MIKLIKSIIGRFTQPDELFTCEVGLFWVSVVGFPTYDYDLRRMVRSYEHRYCYQEMTQGRFGAWRAETSYLGLNSPLHRHDS